MKEGTNSSLKCSCHSDYVNMLPPVPTRPQINFGAELESEFKLPVQDFDDEELDPQT